MKKQVRIVFFLSVLLVYELRSIEFRTSVQESLGQIAMRALGAMIQEMVQDAVNVSRLAYNKVFPHVETIEQTLKRIEAQIIALDRKIAAVGVNVKHDVAQVIEKIKQLPDKEDVEGALTDMHEILTQEQARLSQATAESLAAMEARLNERIADFDDIVNDALRECRVKVDDGQKNLQAARQASNIQHVKTAQTLKELINDNQQIVDALKKDKSN